MQSMHFKSKQEIADTYGVNRNAAYKWIKKDGFPEETKHGWHRRKVAEWVAKHREEVNAMQSGDGDKAEKTRLECERLRVVIGRETQLLTQAEIETERIKGELHSARDCEAEKRGAAATIRAAVENWRAHETAKHPDHREIIDGVSGAVLGVIVDALEADDV